MKTSTAHIKERLLEFMEIEAHSGSMVKLWLTIDG